MEFLHEVLIGLLSRFVWAALAKAIDSSADRCKCVVCDDVIDYRDDIGICRCCKTGLIKVFPR